MTNEETSFSLIQIRLFILYILTFSFPFKFQLFSPNINIQRQKLVTKSSLSLSLNLHKKNTPSQLAMSMSIFSAFEALCAESFFGQKVGFSSPPTLSNNTVKQAPAVKVDDLRNGKEVNSQPENRRRITAPRFAPELDGVHCFETILPY